MHSDQTNITADAVALQERDEFRANGWLKLIAPAKVNLHLAIGALREDGYHEAFTVLHALNLHDVVYMREKLPDDIVPNAPSVRMVSCGDVVAPTLASEDNIASKAIELLASMVGNVNTGLEVRIEKNIPAEGGLGGGSSDAAAALVGAARLWGLADDDPVIEQAARKLGSDVAFFLRGGCACYEGTGEVFVRAMNPSKQAVALVKPDGGVSTAEAYRTFDEHPEPIPAAIAENARMAADASDVTPFNNLASASELIMPQLGNIRTWLANEDGVESVLLCGSGATTFAACSDFAAACRVVATAKNRGFWARATSFGSARALVVAE